ncbi:MAG: hypothetical protein AAF401_00030 [Pseudomonadota bacterium]
MSLKGRIAVIGWGSLIWDLDNLAPFVTGEWMMGPGPRLPFEFTRVSPKRKMGLAVCLDQVNGDPCQTNAILSIRDDIDQTAEELRARERAKIIDWIGMVHPATGARRSSIPEVADIFEDWCAKTGAAGAVWTDLGGNFEEAIGEPFSVSRAISYLKTLSGESLEEAVRYIEYAPKATNTPLRRALADDEWWRSQAEALA